MAIDVTISFLPVDSFECSQVPSAGVRADCAGNGSCHRRAAALHAVRQSGEKCGIRRNTSSDSLLIFLADACVQNQHVKLLTGHMIVEHSIYISI